MVPVSKLWHQLTDPLHPAQDTSTLRQRRLLSALLAVLTCSLIAVIVLSKISSRTTSGDLWIGIAEVFILALLYGMSRTDHYRLTAILCITLASIGTFGIAIPKNSSNDLYFLDYLVVPIFISSLLLSIEATVAFGVINLLGIAIYALLINFPGVTLTSVITGPFCVNLILNGLIMVAIYHRNGLEADRQAAFQRELSERRRAEEALQRSEERLRAIVENVSDVILLVNDQGKVTYGSPAVERVLGYQPADIIGESTFDYVHPVDLERTAASWVQALPQQGIAPPIEIRVKHRDDTWRDMELISNNALHVQGINSIIITARDISERKQTVQRLNRRNEYLKAMQETTMALMKRSNVVDLLDTLVHSSAMLLGMPDTGVFLVAPDDKSMILAVGLGFSKQFIGQRIERGEGFSGTVWQTGQTMVLDDYSIWAQRLPNAALNPVKALVGIPLKSGTQVIGVVLMHETENFRKFDADEIEMMNRFADMASVVLDNARLYNVSQEELVRRKIAEDELRGLNAQLEQRVSERTAELQQERTLLQTILDSMGEGVVYSQHYTIRYANRSLLEMIGYEPNEINGQPNHILLGASATVEERRVFDEEFTRFDTTWRGEVRICRKDGTDFEAALTINLLKVDGDIGAVMIVRDVTMEKQLQSQKARFIANASHELRTPITSIKTRLYLLRRQPEKFEAHIEVLERVSDHITHLVEDLLDVTRFERGTIALEQEIITLQQLISDVAQVQQPEAEQKHIKLTIDVPTQPVLVNADEKRLTQVMFNLLANAINYTAPEGQVSIRLAVTDGGQPPSAAIQVQDTGIGISEANLTRIFDPFFRVEEGAVRGTGLGLCIAKEIVELHDGKLTVDSMVGVGSTFTVKLPVKAGSA